ncbi:hypothetical protein L195_g051093, partial [Trifolium pratense]
MMNSANKGNTTLTDTDETKLSIQNLNNPIATNMQFEIKKIGILFDYDFYIPDEGDHTGIAFRLAYFSVANFSLSNKALCVYVGSMLCSVVPGLRTSVEKSLNEIGVRARFVKLPSQAKEYKLDITYASQLDWSSILVIFGYSKFRWDPSTKLSIPLDGAKVNIISTMLSSDDLRATVKKFLISSSNHPDSQIDSGERVSELKMGGYGSNVFHLVRSSSDDEYLNLD